MKFVSLFSNSILKLNTIFKRGHPHVVNIIVGGTNKNWRIVILTSLWYAPVGRRKIKKLPVTDHENSR